jgi:hypothetical protein
MGLLQFRQMDLRLIEPIGGNQIRRQQQTLFQFLLPLQRLAVQLQLGNQAGGLGVGRVKLQHSSVLLLGFFGISLPHRALAGGDGLTHLAKPVAILQSALL